MEPIFADTLSIISQIFPKEPSVRYKSLLKYRQLYEGQTKSSITIVNEDCIDACVRIAKSDMTCRIGLLNMASERCPGGGVKQFAIAQEEDIYRRTSLYPTLLQQHYPIRPDEVFYSPNVKVIKNADFSRLLPMLNIAGIVSAAAIRRPVIKNGEFTSVDAALLKNKVRMVLETFEYHAMDHIVLGAWGCGAFRNPPKQVAIIFRDILEEFYFQHVTFAIAHNERNLNTFKEVFSYV